MGLFGGGNSTSITAPSEAYQNAPVEDTGFLSGNLQVNQSASTNGITSTNINYAADNDNIGTAQGDYTSGEGSLALDTGGGSLVNTSISNVNTPVQVDYTSSSGSGAALSSDTDPTTGASASSISSWIIWAVIAFAGYLILKIVAK
jgi:hypothetical protein